MLRIFPPISFLILLLLLSPADVNAEGSSQRCLPCEDVQHAADLAVIEEKLFLANNNSLELLDEKERDWYDTFQEGGFFLMAGRK